MEKKTKLLIAVTEDVLFLLLEYNLVKRLFEISRATTEAEVIENIIECKPNLIIMSERLNDTNAFQVFKNIKESEDIREAPPSILISPVVDKNKIRLAGRLGISGYIVEPFDLDDLISKIDNVMGMDKIVDTVKVMGKVVLALKGCVSYHHTKLIIDSLNALAGAKQTKIVIDLTETEFLAHQVLLVFISALQKFRYLEGNLIICGPNPGIQILLDRSGVSKAFEIYPDRSTALKKI